MLYEVVWVGPPEPRNLDALIAADRDPLVTDTDVAILAGWNSVIKPIFGD